VFNFVADRIVKGRIYPALSEWQARPYTQAWREFGQHWPWTTPLRVQEYCEQHGMRVNIFSAQDELPPHTYYPIAIGFFDFTVDYMSMLPGPILQALRARKLRVLFMYHEGDNPRQIKTRLDHLCHQQQLDTNCYVFVSSNSAAAQLPGFVHFDDFELWYYQRNISQPPAAVNHGPRTKDFCVLSRMHKSWRAAVITDLQRENLLDRSYWSYGQYQPDAGAADDCPIEVDRIPRLRWDREKFLQGVPYRADTLTDEQHNDHSITVIEHHENAYCNIVLESQFDVDASGGSFLTEKTFKPIKHGQMFVIAGGPGSLTALKRLGYRTFDHVIDPGYDSERDATERWILLRKTIQDIYKRGLHQVFQQCLDDIQHNQQLFMASKLPRLNNLSDQINEQYC